MSSKIWRVAYAGAGAIVRYAHIPNFGALPNVEHAAVCDVDAARVSALAAATNIPGVYTDYRTMIEEIQPDIVVVATPNVFHKEMTLVALEAGAHVLCEKPIALTYDDAEEMFAVAAARQRTLTVGTHYRFSAPMQTCKTQVSAGFFGRIYFARTIWNRRNGIPGIGGWFTNRDLAGGGVLFDLGMHALDRALYLMGYPKPAAVSGASFAEFGPRGKGAGSWGMDAAAAHPGGRFDVDDFSTAFVRFEDGAALLFQVAWASYGPDAYVTEIYGTNGGAVIGNREGVDFYTDLNGQPAVATVPLPTNPPASYGLLVQNFVCYLDGDPTAEIVTPEQALVSARIVDAIGRSAGARKEVQL